MIACHVRFKFGEPCNYLFRLQIVILDNDGGGHSDHGGHIEYVVSGYGKKSKKEKKRKNKKKHWKKFTMTGIAGIGAFKFLLYHFFVKKMALLSFFSFILSKISFLTSTLIALKQFFSHQTHHDRSESQKLEVVHIPIRKFNSKKQSEHNRLGSDESKINNYLLSSQEFSITSTAKTYPDMYFRDDRYNRYNHNKNPPNKLLYDYKFI